MALATKPRDPALAIVKGFSGMAGCVATPVTCPKTTCVGACASGIPPRKSTVSIALEQSAGPLRATDCASLLSQNTSSGDVSPGMHFAPVLPRRSRYKGPVPCACAVILGSDLAMCTLGRHGATVGWYSLLGLCVGIAQSTLHLLSLLSIVANSSGRLRARLHRLPRVRLHRRPRCLIWLKFKLLLAGRSSR